jgi:hypothetical protein
MLSFDSTDYRRLTSSAQWSDTQLRKPRESRKVIMQRLCGPHYPVADAVKERRPINFLELGSDLFRRNLASHQPQAMVTTDYQELLPTATDFESVLNRKLGPQSLNVQAAFNTCALEALISMGVMCVGISVEHEVDPGKTFCEPVLLPELILDMNARSWDTQSYVGHEFDVPVDWVLNNPLFDTGDAKKFINACKSQWRRNDEDWKRSRENQFEETVRLRQLYLPRRNCVVIDGCEASTGKPLFYDEWQGPAKGPYIPLAFRTVPGKVLALGPMQFWLDLDEAANKALWKTMRQAMRSKTIGLTMSPEDAKTVKDASDGEVVGVLAPDPIKEQAFGGANRDLLAMVQVCKQLLVWFGGNWDAIGGLAPQSGTLGQDKLLADGAAGRLKEMQQTMIEFQTNVVSSIAFWEWQNPLSNERFTKRLAGSQFSMPSVWGPEARKGEFFQFNYSVNPYSLVNRSPTEQAQTLTQILETVVLPSLPYMQQEGPIDWQLFFKLMSRYMHLPELNDVLRWPDGGELPQSAPERPKMPAKTTRTYQSVNRTDPQNQQDAMMQLLMQPSTNGNGNGKA